MPSMNGPDQREPPMPLVGTRITEMPPRLSVETKRSPLSGSVAMPVALGYWPVPSPKEAYGEPR